MRYTVLYLGALQDCARGGGYLFGDTRASTESHPQDPMPSGCQGLSCWFTAEAVNLIGHRLQRIKQFYNYTRLLSLNAVPKGGYCSSGPFQ